ncbi:mechanosensitive ion channel family protein [Pseudalkalibacillus caeni]|uniref:Mechanosensitive ion channel family protein n=1 Tax=Exobacillus caeni TaxID=2574798 RepID=A0A5R9F3V3_9BACL|nr:mechanosensitive ion channel family protein [Pseudalkalibacillus caeni]TLS35144.1 mechanosensitive ion channel family protein [Pseudalkalibacillus caeni]
MGKLNRLWAKMYDDYLANTELWVDLSFSALKIIAIVIGTWLFIKIGKSMLNRIFHFRLRSPLRLEERREATLIRLIENVFTYAVYFIAFIMVLSELGVDVRTLIAGAGVVGLAVGFGAQNLVRDIISGFFIIFEKQFSVGDYVKISSFEGFVEEIGVRITKIKSWTGELHIIPNGSIAEVTNFSVHNSVAVVDISIAYEENIPEAEEAVVKLLDELYEKHEEMVAKPEYLGVQTLGASEVVMRITAEVTPMAHWKIGRLIRKAVKLRLDELGIEIPFPRLVMYQRDENGNKEISKASE